MAEGRHILLVEDEPTLQRILGSVLTDAGHEVESVGTAEAAVTRLEDTGAPDVDLVLADKNLPAMSGLELLERVRKDEFREGRARGFVLVTGYPSRDSALAVLADGGDGYMVKPFRSLVHAVEEVQAVLRAPLTKRRQASAIGRAVVEVLGGKAAELPADLRVALLLDDDEAARRAKSRLEARGARLVSAEDLAAPGPRALLAGRVEDLVTFAREQPDTGLVLADEGAAFADLVALIRAGGGAVVDLALVSA